jgi:hypothetical protein
MNDETHKTIRVHATMHTDLFADINVPIDTDEDDIWQFIRDGNIDGGVRDQLWLAEHATGYGDMVQYEGFMSSGWTWEDPIYDYEFNPDAVDVSEEILKS